jgi:hypothetical protein
MLKLPKEHLSVSQINLWESDPIAYQKKYFIGIPDPPSPFLEFGKQFAKDIEDYAAGVQRDFNFPEGFLDMTLIYPHVEYKLEHDFGDFKMLGYIDNMSKDYELVVDFKTGTCSLVNTATATIVADADLLLNTCGINLVLCPPLSSATGKQS